jgi:hypothetical protein
MHWRDSLRRDAEGLPLLAHQTRVLSERYVELLLHDTQTLFLLILQAPLIVLLLGVSFPAADVVFAPNLHGSGRSALAVLFILVAAAIFFGASNAGKEIVKERAILRRERLVNLRLVPYVLSKGAVLGVVGLAQSALLVGFCLLLGLLPLENGPGLPVALTLMLGLTALAGASMGLCLSAMAPSADFAASMVPVILLPQLLFCGVLVAPDVWLHYPPGAWMAHITVASWAFELAGHLTNLQDVLGRQGATTLASEYAPAFAAAGWLPHVVVLAAFTAFFLVATVVALKLSPHGP